MILFAYTLLLAYLSNEQASCEILRLSCETYANFSIVSHNKRVNHTFRTIPGTDRQTCQLECSQNAKCKSINVKNVDHSCELNNKSFHDPKDRAVTLESSGWVIYSPSYKERLVSVLHGAALGSKIFMLYSRQCWHINNKLAQTILYIYRKRSNITISHSYI